MHDRIYAHCNKNVGVGPSLHWMAFTELDLQNGPLGRAEGPAERELAASMPAAAANYFEKIVLTVAWRRARLALRFVLQEVGIGETSP